MSEELTLTVISISINLSHEDQETVFLIARKSDLRTYSEYPNFSGMKNQRHISISEIKIAVKLLTLHNFVCLMKVNIV